MMERVGQVVKQTKARVFKGLTKLPDKIVSLFEPHTEIIWKGKAGKPNEFGKLVQLQEAENQIITHFEVYDDRPADQRLLLPAIETHQRKLGRVPRLVAADAGYYSRSNAGYYSRSNEEAAPALGVRFVSIPNRATKSAQRRELQKRRWFKKWPTLAHRMRGAHQHRKTSTRTGAVPIPRHQRDATLGRSGSDRR